VFTGIHPDWPGCDCGLIFDAISAFEVKAQVETVTVQGCVEKVFAVDDQIREDQAGTLWRKIDYGCGEQTRKRYAGMHILQPDAHFQVMLNPVRSEKEGNHNHSLIQPFS